MRGTIGIYFTDPNELGYPLSQPMYFEAYKELAAFCAHQHLRVVFVRGNSHMSDTTFSHGWEFQKNKLVHIPDPITVDLIYNKCVGEAPKSFPADKTLNNPRLDAICANKLLTYQQFPEFVIPTFEISPTNWQQAIAQIATDKVVLKPIDGEEGRGIVILTKDTFQESDIPSSEPYVAQPFLDSSTGIPGVFLGIHDLRVIVFNGIPTLATIRQAAHNELISNVARGASLTVLPIEKVPQTALDIVASIDKKFESFSPRAYTVDFMFQNGVPSVVELNSRPGLPKTKVHGETYKQTFFKSLSDCFLLALHQQI